MISGISMIDLPRGISAISTSLDGYKHNLISSSSRKHNSTIYHHSSLFVTQKNKNSKKDYKHILHYSIASLENESISIYQKVNVSQPKRFYLEEKNEEILSERLVNLSRRNNPKSALVLYHSMEYSNLKPSVHSLNSLLSCLIRNNLLEEALTVFEFMKVNEILTSHTYSIVLKAISNTKGYEIALNMFYNSESKYFDAIVYNTMISIFAKMNNWVETVKIWRYMQENNHIGTIITYRLLICLFVRCEQNELALDAYYEMIYNKIEPSEDSMQAIIKACGKEGEFDLALRVLNNMLKNDLNPSLISFNSVINVLGKAGKVEDAIKVFKIMKSLNYEPDKYTWNAILVAFYKSNRYSDVLLIFERLKRKKKCVMNLNIYNTGLMSCQRLGLWDKALQILLEMEGSGILVNSSCYNFVIGACEVARRPEIALEVYAHMCHIKLSPDIFTMLSLIRGCIWGNRFDEVEEILNGFVANGSLYNEAIQGLCLRGEIDLARRFYRKMNENGLIPDGKTRALMLQNLKKKIRFKR